MARKQPPEATAEPEPKASKRAPKEPQDKPSQQITAPEKIIPPEKFDRKVRTKHGLNIYVDKRYAPIELYWAKVEDLVLDPNNAKEHGERSIESLIGSFTRFGQQGTIVVQSQSRIIGAGNGTTIALAERMGWKYVRVHLTDLLGDEFTAFCLAHNRSAEHNEWNWEVVAAQLKMIQEGTGDISNLGWKDYEWEPLLQAEWRPQQVDGLENEPGAGKNENEAGKPEMVMVPLTGSTVRAVEFLRARVGKEDLSAVEALELICEEWLAEAGQ